MKLIAYVCLLSFCCGTETHIILRDTALNMIKCVMVTDEILCAVQGMIELFPTPEARNAGKAIWNMLADFEEENWYETVNSGIVRKWLQHYIEN